MKILHVFKTLEEAKAKCDELDPGWRETPWPHRPYYIQPGEKDEKHISSIDLSGSFLVVDDTGTPADHCHNCKRKYPY
jgi:hypothetical protein